MNPGSNLHGSLDRMARAVAAALLLATGSEAAFAGDDGQALWKSECGSCHALYPRTGLPASSWRSLMGSLDDHFGVDASVDAATAATILAWLQAGAGREASPRPAGPVLRITETDWFRREHDELGAGAFSRPSIKGASNCGACHRGATEGLYDEHDINIPR